MGEVCCTVIIEWDPEEALYIATVPVLSVAATGTPNRKPRIR